MTNIARPAQDASSHLSQTFASIMILVILALLIIKLLFLFQVPYFPTVNRVTYAGSTYNVSLIDPYWDSMLLTVLSAVACLLAARSKLLSAFLLAAVVVNVFLFQQQQFFALDIIASLAGMTVITVTIYTYIKGNPLLDARWFLIAAAIIQTAILTRWLLHPAFPTRIFGDVSWKLNEVYASLQTVSGLLVPALILLVVFSFVLFPNRRFIDRALAALSRDYTSDYKSIKSGILDRILSWHRLYLVVFVLSFAIPLYPHIQSINPDAQVLNVDAAQYGLWMDQMRSADSDALYRLVFSEIQSGDRPAALLFIYGIYNLVGQNSSVTFMILPSILSVLLVSSVFFVVGSLGRKRLYQNLAAIVTLVSFQIIAGMYGGLFSNWFALVMVNLSVAFMLRYLEQRSFMQLGLAFVTSVSIIFVHSATWLFFVAAAGIFLGISAYVERNRATFFALAALAAILVASFVIDQTKSALLSSVNTFQLNSDITQEKLGAEEFVLRWNNLRYLSTIHFWGAFANVTLVMLALIWCLKADLHSRFNRFIMSMFFVGSIPMIIGGFDVQARFLYNMPFHIAAAVMLAQQLENRKFSIITSLGVLVILLDLVNYLFRFLANMYFIAPPS